MIKVNRLFFINEHYSNGKKDDDQFYLSIFMQNSGKN